MIEIVGLVRDGKYHSLGEAPQRHVYLPFLQGYTASFTFVLRTAGDPRSLASAARAELRKLDAALPITNIKTMDEHLGFAYWGAEFGAGLLSTFALLGLVLTVLRLFIQRGLAISIAGAFAGTLAALATTRALASYLHGVSPSNPAVFAAVAVLLLAVAFVASYLPSRRAARIEPIRALRNE